MEAVWEVDTADFSRRKRAARACFKCAKTKKRCVHTFVRLQESPGEPGDPHLISSFLALSTPRRESADTLQPATLVRKPRASKHARRVSQTGIRNLAGNRQQRSNQADEPSPASKVVSGSNSPGAARDADDGHEHLPEPQWSYLKSVGSFRILPRSTQDVLITTYTSSINSLLPILDSVKFLRQYHAGQASRFLIQAICLVACKTQQAMPSLRLSADGPLIAPIQFARKIYIGLDAAMKANLESDRLTKVQILTLIHLYNDGTYGIEDSSTHLSQAIQLAWAMKIHFSWPNRSTGDESSMLWWSLWSLDRFNACISGTPIMILDRDIHLPRPPLTSDPQSQVITVWLRLGDLLGEVFDLYRPQGSRTLTRWDEGNISFATITDGLDPALFQTSHWVALELCFQVVAILSCRPCKPGSVSYSRRIAACDRIQVLMSENHHTQLPPLPVIPYAATLSLTGALSVLRDSRKDKNIAQGDVVVRCQVLENLSTCWQNADVVAKLGKVALRNLEQHSGKMQDFTGLLTGIDADSEHDKEAIRRGSNDRQATGVTDTADLSAAGTFPSDTSIAAESISPGDVPGSTSVQVEQISNVVQYSNIVPTSYYDPSPYLSQTTRQNMSSEFSSTAISPGLDFPALFGNAENMQDFNQLSFFEGFFDLGMPTSLQDVMSDGTLFLNGMGEEFWGTDAYETQFQNYRDAI